VVWHVSSRGDVDEEPVRRRAVVAATRSPASLWHRNLRVSPRPLL
jgi:hypothetical protein